VRFDRPRQVKRRFHSQIRNSILHDLEVNSDDTRHLDCPTERDFTITLGEVQISNTEFCPLDMHREKDLAAAAQVLDVAVSTMLRASRDSSSTFTSNLFFDILRGTTCMDVLGIGRLGYDSVQLVGCNKLSFTLVPSCQDLRSVSIPYHLRTLRLDKLQLKEHSLGFRGGSGLEI
jgi:hypothetical protein